MKRKGRNIVFSGLLGVVMTLLVLLILELMLALSGFHFYPPLDFFDVSTGYSDYGDDVYLYEGYGAFTGDYPRPEVPPRQLPPKQDNEFRIFLFGGSVAHNMGLYVHNLVDELEQTYPGVNVTFVDYAYPGIGTETLRTYYQDTFSQDPDMILIHAGNNEYYERLFERDSSSLLLEKLNHLFLSHLRMYQLLSYISFHIHTSMLDDSEDPAFILSEFELNNVPIDVVVERYERNLQHMIEVAQTYEVPIVLSTVGYNRCFIWGEDAIDHEKGMQLLLTEGMESAAPYLEHSFSRVYHIWSANTRTNQAVKDVAQKYGVGYVDIDSAILDEYKPEYTSWEFFIDEVHYTDYAGEVADKWEDWDIVQIETDPCFLRYLDQVANGTYGDWSDVPDLHDVWTHSFAQYIIDHGYLEQKEAQG